MTVAPAPSAEPASSQRIARAFLLHGSRDALDARAAVELLDRTIDDMRLMPAREARPHVGAKRATERALRHPEIARDRRDARGRLLHHDLGNAAEARARGDRLRELVEKYGGKATTSLWIWRAADARHEVVHVGRATSAGGKARASQ